MRPSPSPLETDVADGYGNKVERVERKLRSMMTRGEILPGEHLRQDQLAHTIGATRVPVREAFKTLVAEGLLEHRRNSGHYVVKLTSHGLLQLCWLRSALEARLAQHTRWPDDAELRRVEEINAEILGLSAEPESVFDVVELDLAFHYELWQLSDQELLAREMLRIRRLMGPYRAATAVTKDVVRNAQIVEEHEKIIQALRDKNLEEYEKALVDHVGLSYRIADYMAEKEEAGEI